MVTPVAMESMLGYHPFSTRFLTTSRQPAGGQCQVWSLTGPVASERVSVDNASGEIEVPVKMLVTCARTERPHGALLQFGTGIRCCMYRIGGRLRTHNASCVGVAVGIPPLQYWVSNQPP